MIWATMTTKPRNAWIMSHTIIAKRARAKEGSLRRNLYTEESVVRIELLSFSIVAPLGAFARKNPVLQNRV
jgi:hypothetical protein